MPSPHPPVLVAPDSFKGTLRAARVAVLHRRGPRARRARPARPLPGRRRRRGHAGGPAHRAGRRDRGRAGDRPARAADRRGGLRADRGRRDGDRRGRRGVRAAPGRRGRARRRSRRRTRGTGELIVAAAAAGAAVVLVAAGGSATTDGGAGAIAAIEEAGGLQGTALVVLCDVRTPFELAPARVRPAEGRRRQDHQEARATPATAGRDAAQGPARRPDDRRGGRSGRRAVGALRRQAGAGRRVHPAGAGLRRAHARRARGDRRRGPARRHHAWRARSPARSPRARARPACRVTRSSATNAIDRFSARILDLQVIAGGGDGGGAGRRRRAVGADAGGARGVAAGRGVVGVQFAALVVVRRVVCRHRGSESGVGVRGAGRCPPAPAGRRGDSPPDQHSTTHDPRVSRARCRS